jgi:hypothetical protein
MDGTSTTSRRQASAGSVLATIQASTNAFNTQKQIHLTIESAHGGVATLIERNNTVSSGFAKLVIEVSGVASVMFLLPATPVTYVSFHGTDNQPSVCQGCKPGPQVAMGYDNTAPAPPSEVMSRRVTPIALI